jgi:hypothetical protein
LWKICPMIEIRRVFGQTFCHYWHFTMNFQKREGQLFQTETLG